jgi:hypothetical protein
VKNIIKEPLFHFLLIGSIMFLVYGFVSGNQTKDEIVIDNSVINDLSAKWKLQWKREPTIDEVERLVGLYIDQEVLYREALSMNLDHNDEIIKRRLAKKMEFLSDDLAESLQPTEEILKDYYQKNKSDYAKPPMYTFSQIFFNAQNRTSPLDDARKALKSKNPITLGDPLSLPQQFSNISGNKVAIDFGSRFAISLDTLEIGSWTGPIKSGYGVHLVLIDQKESSGIYSFEEVSDKVNLDYNFHASNEFRQELINTFLKNYKIKFELDNQPLKQELIESY